MSEYDEDDVGDDLLDDDKPALAAILDGREADLLLERGGVLRTLLLQARAESASALKRLMFCEPDDVKAIAGHQRAARRYADLVRWISEIIVEGRRLEDELTEEGQATLAAIERGEKEETHD